MTTATETYWVSIGRNVGAEPLSDEGWECFQDATEKAILRRRASILTSVAGVSDWQGLEEQTVLYLLTISSAEVPTLRIGLAHLAKSYRQDAIGFVGGPGETLVTA